MIILGVSTNNLSGQEIEDALKTIVDGTWRDQYTFKFDSGSATEAALSYDNGPLKLTAAYAQLKTLCSGSITG